MFILEGKYNKAFVYATNCDSETLSQISLLLDQEFCTNSNIAIMPDCHAGKGCTIGTTMTLNNKVVPNLVGVDIGCGMLTIELGKMKIDFEKLDNFIFNNIPSGTNIHKTRQTLKTPIQNLKCFKNLSKPLYYIDSIGTLGGGNHFIEIDKDESDNLYLIIHTGSRNLGLQIATYYQNKAILYHKNLIEEKIKEVIKNSPKQDIEKNIKIIKNSKLPDDLSYLENELFDDYLFDMDIACSYATENRFKIATSILNYLNLDLNNLVYFETVHNYIKDKVLRKGAISCYKDEIVLIPINMKDGCIIGRGLGNINYNYSGPHGAGRILSRTSAFKTILLEDFVSSMKGIYTNSISSKTIDESPFVYKPIEEIIENIQETVEIIKIIKPLYNFKAN